MLMLYLRDFFTKHKSSAESRLLITLTAFICVAQGQKNCSISQEERGKEASLTCVLADSASTTKNITVFRMVDDIYNTTKVMVRCLTINDRPYCSKKEYVTSNYNGKLSVEIPSNITKESKLFWCSTENSQLREHQNCTIRFGKSEVMKEGETTKQTSEPVVYSSGPCNKTDGSRTSSSSYPEGTSVLCNVLFALSVVFNAVFGVIAICHRKAVKFCKKKQSSEPDLEDYANIRNGLLETPV